VINKMYKQGVEPRLYNKSESLTKLDDPYTISTSVR